jgi:carbon monoxide dehydrogenase subunit G
LKISGQATLSAPVEQVYAVLHDPAVLAATVPGCQAFDVVGTGSYRMTVAIGVGALKGTFAGTILVDEPRPPHSFSLRASGAGGIGSVAAELDVTLTPDPAGTVLRYVGDLTADGTVSALGSHLLTRAANRLAAEFCRCVDRTLTAGAPGTGDVPPAPSPGLLRAPLSVLSAAGGLLARAGRLAG